MNAKSLFLLALVYLFTNCAPTFANGRAKWLIDSRDMHAEVHGVVISEPRTPPDMSARSFDYDHQGEIPRGSNIKSLSAAIGQQVPAKEGLSFIKTALPSRTLNIYSFRLIRLLLFPHHVFD